MAFRYPYEQVLQPFNGLFSRTTWVSQYQKGKTNLEQETVSSSGISWAICKSAPRSRQITMPALHNSVFLQAGCPSCHPTNSVIALKAQALKAQPVIYPYEQVEKIKLKNKIITPLNPQYDVLLLDVPYHWHCLHSMWRRVYATAGSPSVRPSVPFACHTLLLQVCCCGPSRQEISTDHGSRQALQQLMQAVTRCQLA